MGEIKDSDILEVRYDYKGEYLYSYGETSKFFKEVLVNKKLYGTKCPKCGKPLKNYISRFSAACECGFSATYGKLPNGKYYLVWVDKK